MPACVLLQGLVEQLDRLRQIGAAQMLVPARGAEPVEDVAQGGVGGAPRASGSGIGVYVLGDKPLHQPAHRTADPCLKRGGAEHRPLAKLCEQQRVGQRRECLIHRSLSICGVLACVAEGTAHAALL